MPQTPNSALTAYCSPVQFFQFFARELAADMLKANSSDPRPSYLAMIDNNNPAGQKLLVHLDKGAGEIEASCGIALRYSPADLQALAGVSLTLLQGLNAARCLWSLYQVLKPGSARLEECPSAKASEDLLHELRDGEMIFGFIETQEAGLPSVVPPRPQSLLTPNVVSRARRLFPSYGINGQPPWGRNG